MSLAGRSSVGSGMEALFPVKEDRQVRTELGEVTVHICSTGKTEFYFLPRHGREHEIPPHLINHKANLRALESLGVGGIIATSAVGAISTKIKVGGIGLLDQFIDMSASHLTFFEGSPVHADMTNPYDRGVQEAVALAAYQGADIAEPGPDLRVRARAAV